MTRSEPDAAAFAASCKAAGFAPVLAPLIDIQVHSASLDLSDVSALAFTSANGVRAFALSNPDRSLPVFAVGEATEKAAEQAGFAAVFVAEGDVTSLAALIAARRDMLNGSVLHSAGTHRAGDLAQLLHAHSIAYRRVVLYEARAASAIPKTMEAFLREANTGWFTLCSPRTARIFMALSEDAGITAALSSKHAVCLSDAVADALGDDALGADVLVGPRFRSVAIAERRTSEAMIELMQREVGA